MQNPAPLVPALKSNWLMMHVTVMMLSYASLIFGSLLGIFFLVLTSRKVINFNLQGSSFGKAFSKSVMLDKSFYNSDLSVEYPKLMIEDQDKIIK